MNNLNSILVEGNLVRDPTISTTPKGTPVAKLVLASNRYYKLPDSAQFEKEVSFFEVSAWGTLAEAAVKRGKKGRGVRVVGRLKQDRWTGADGKTCSKVYIVAEHVEFRPDIKKETVTEESPIPEDTNEEISEENSSVPLTEEEPVT